jgi:hypothetical protein
MADRFFTRTCKSAEALCPHIGTKAAYRQTKNYSEEFTCQQFFARDPEKVLKVHEAQ